MNYNDNNKQFIFAKVINNIVCGYKQSQAVYQLPHPLLL